MRLLGRPLVGMLSSIVGILWSGVGVVLTIIAGMVLVVWIVAVAAHHPRNSVESTSPQTPEIAPASEDVFDVAAKQLQPMPPVDVARTAPSPPKVEPPQITPVPESAKTYFTLLPPDELALRVGTGCLNNGCFACDINTDSSKSRWTALDITAKVTVFRANGGPIESRLCPLQFVSIAPGKIYTTYYSATVGLELRTGDRWEWKIVEAHGFPNP